MARPRSQPATALGQAVQRRRGLASLREAAEIVGIPDTTLSRVERGTHAPSVATARALAKWLGWTIEQVLEAAETPADAT